MPFRSKAQVSKLFALDPELAREFAKKTKELKKLPQRVKPRITK